ncbi:MAG: hypothetical protein AAFZ63_26725 [Bacteroidota bacterium]
MVPEISKLYKSQIKYIIDQFITSEAASSKTSLPVIEVRPSQVNYNAMKAQLSLLWESSPVYREKIERWIRESILAGDQEQVIAMDPVTGLVSITAIIYFYKLSEKVIDGLSIPKHLRKGADQFALKNPAPEISRKINQLYHHSIQADTRHFIRSKCQAPQKADILILTIVEVEYQAVISFLQNIAEVEGLSGTKYSMGDFGRFKVAVRRCLLQGSVNMGIEADRALHFFKPNFAILTGMAAALRQKVTLGDVVIASLSFYYESGKETVGGFRFRPRGGAFHFEFLEQARYLADNMLQLWSEKTPPEFKALVGTIVAGEKVVTTDKTRLVQDIKQQFEDALALSMEGYGLLSALNGHPNTKGLEIRGISDIIAMGNKDVTYHDGSRERAATNAARFTFRLLSYQEQNSLYPTTK